MKKNNNTNKKKLSLTKFLIIIIILIFLIIILFTSPMFKIKIINLEGTEKYSKEEILSKIKLNDNDNIFMVKPIYSKKILEKEAYIKSADIKIKFPSQVDIIIKERKVRGYVPYIEGTYLYIDEDGRVLESSKTYNKKLPIVDGLIFEEGFKIGEILKVKNQKSFEVVVKTANILAKYESEYDEIDDIVKIDVNDPDNICIYIKNIKVLLGDLTQYDFKIRKMLTIVKEIPDKNKGFLDITQPENDSIFEFLT